jgi:hypothetical protein
MREAKGKAKKKFTRAELLKREKAIIADIKAGLLSYRQIAAKHSVSLPTVNNKARKAGISRGRRKGAKIVVLRPKAKAVKVTRKAARKAGRKPARRGRRPKAAPPAAAKAPKVRARRTVRRGVGRPRKVRRGRPPGVPAVSAFAGAFRLLVLKHYPKISLVKFDRLARLVEHEVR